MVVVTFIANATSGIGGYPFGLFFVPMGATLGWSRTAISWALTIRAVSSMFMGPILGPLADRKHGPQLIMTFGGLLLGGFIMLTGTVNELWQFYLYFGIGYGASSAMMSSDILTPTVIAKWFIRLRGRAIAISVMGMSLGGLMFIPLTSFMIINIGWREAWFVLGIVGVLLVAPPSALFIRRTPEDIGLLPDGDSPTQGSLSSEDYRFSELATDRAWTLSEVVKTSTLWLMVLAFSIGSAGLGGFVAHSIPFMTDNGYSDVSATTYLVLFSIVAAAVKPVWGLLGERFQVRYLVAAAFAISGAGMLALAWLDGGPMIGVTLVAYGCGAGAFLPLMNLMWANYYGRASLGTIRGVFLPITQIVLALSPVFAGYIFDATGRYALAFLIFGVLFLLGMVAILAAKPPKAPS